MSALMNKAHAPTSEQLRQALGRSHAAWERLQALVGERIPPVAPVWKFSEKTGWGLRLVRKERVILYMTPQVTGFVVSFALGEKAVVAARSARLSAELLKVIEAAPRYAEGRGVRIPVKDGAQVAALARLAEIKNEH